MILKKTFAGVVLGLLASGMAASSHAYTLPPGYIFDLAASTNDGAASVSYTYYSTSFTALSATTTVSFIPQGRSMTLDDLSVGLTSGGPNLLADPGFEAAQLYSDEPAGWTTFAQPSTGGGVGFSVDNSKPYDGAQELYVFGDPGGLFGISQTLATAVGSNYTVGFYLGLSGEYFDYPSNFGSGYDVTVYAQPSLPAGTGGVPEPATWTLMLVGFAALGAALRMRRAAILA